MTWSLLFFDAPSLLLLLLLLAVVVVAVTRFVSAVSQLSTVEGQTLIAP
jgi:hypothetical protein